MKIFISTTDYSSSPELIEIIEGLKDNLIETGNEVLIDNSQDVIRKLNASKTFNADLYLIMKVSSNARQSISTYNNFNLARKLFIAINEILGFGEGVRRTKTYELSEGNNAVCIDFGNKVLTNNISTAISNVIESEVNE